MLIFTMKFDVFKKPLAGQRGARENWEYFKETSGRLQGGTFGPPGLPGGAP